jgi:hypothetical protein
MGAEQHRRSSEGHAAQKQYPRIGIRGHYLDGVLYAAISLGGPLLALVDKKWTPVLLIPIALIPVVLFAVRYQDRKTIRFLGRNRSAALSVEAED